MLPDLGLPLIGYRFGVVISTGAVPQLLDARFQEVSGLNFDRNISFDNQKPSVKQESTLKTLTLKRGVALGSPLTLVHLLETEYWNERILQNDILVSLLSNDLIPLMAWVITDAYLEKWSWDSLNAINNQVLIENMVYKYTDIRVVAV